MGKGNLWPHTRDATQWFDKQGCRRSMALTLIEAPAMYALAPQLTPFAPLMYLLKCCFFRSLSSLTYATTLAPCYALIFFIAFFFIGNYLIHLLFAHLLVHADTALISASHICRIINCFLFYIFTTHIESSNTHTPDYFLKRLIIPSKRFCRHLWMTKLIIKLIWY